MQNLRKYMISDEDGRELQESFVELLSDVDLHCIDLEKHQESLKDYDYGIYFWVLTLNNVRYKVYIGKTNSIVRRVKEYTIDFQIHSPNDFKMRFFQDFIAKSVSSFDLSLYFSPKTKETYTQSETQAIRYFKPMINERSNTSSDQKASIKKAFSQYYESVFSSKLCGL